MLVIGRRRPSSAVAAFVALAMVVAVAPFAPVDAAYAQPSAQFAAVDNIVTGPFTTRIATGDLNNDGFDDAVVTLVEEDVEEGIQVLLNDGMGSYNAQDPIVFEPDDVEGEPPHLGGHVIADLNGDGNKDVAVASEIEGIIVLNGNGTGALTQGTNIPVAVVGEPTDIVAADFNGDGRKDLAVIDDATVRVLLQGVGGTFALSATVPLAGTFEPDAISIAAGDVDGDGVMDLAVSHFRARDAEGDRDGRIDILRNVGNGSSFDLSTVMVTSGGANPRLGPLAMGDLNGDGRADIVVTAEDGTRVLLAGPGGTFSAAAMTMIGAGATSDVAIADFDLDKNLDIVVLDVVEEPEIEDPEDPEVDAMQLPNLTASVFINVGNGTFTPGPVLDTGIEGPEAAEPSIAVAYWPTPDSQVTVPPFVVKPHILVTHPDLSTNPEDPEDPENGVLGALQLEENEGAVSLFFNLSLDVVAPVSTLHVDSSAPDGRNGWYITEPMLHFMVDEPADVFFSWDPGALPADFMMSSETTPPVMPGTGEHTIRWFAVDLSDNVETPIQSRTLKWDPALGAAPGIARQQGANRYLTAIDVSMKNFASADAVVLATGEKFPDALAGSGLAGTIGAPILLTSRNALIPAVMAEIARLGATRVYILGGEQALSPAVAQAIVASGRTVERIGGTDRFHTAALIAEKMKVLQGAEWQGMAFFVRGDEFADAVAVSPFAYNAKIPILLVRSASVTARTSAAVGSLPIGTGVIAGGTAAVSATVQARLTALGVVTTREDGPTRFETAVAVAERGVAEGWGAWRTVGIATGMEFPDALTGGAAIGKRGGVSLLVHPTRTLNASVSAALTANEPEIAEIIVFGGPVAVSSSVFNALKALVDAVDSLSTMMVAAQGVTTDATGRAWIRVGANSVTYSVEVENLSNITMSHIHIAPTPGGSGPPGVWLYPSSPPAELIPGVTTGVLASGTFTADDFVGPLEGMAIAALVTAIDQGRAYVHVHTEAHPGGEITGFLQ